MYKGVIAIDMDGTLLQRDFIIKEKDLVALKKAHSLGYLLVICTGRGASVVINNLANWGLDEIVDVIIGSNGSQYYSVKDSKEIEDLGWITKACIEEGLKLCGNEKFGFAWYNGERMFSNKHNHRLSIMSQQMKLEVILLEDDELIDYLPDRWPKAVFFLKEERQRYLKDHIEKHKTEPFDLVFSEHLFLEMIPAGINKGTGLDEVCKRYNIDHKDTMAIGDGENDLLLLKKSGYGVAMGNAVDLLKDIADYVTDTSENCGVAQAIEKYLKIKE